jgi:hypothetical protein
MVPDQIIVMIGREPAHIGGPVIVLEIFEMDITNAI